MDQNDRDDARGCFGGYSLAGMHRINTREVFRELIAQELRGGRLTPARRRRLVRFGEQFRLSAAETGRLIAECRAEALESGDPEVTHHALRVVEPPPAEWPVFLKFTVLVAGVIVMHLLLSRWL